MMLEVAASIPAVMAALVAAIHGLGTAVVKDQPRGLRPLSHTPVMAWLVPAIHVFGPAAPKGVDTRPKARA